MALLLAMNSRTEGKGFLRGQKLETLSQLNKTQLNIRLTSILKQFWSDRGRASSMMMQFPDRRERVCVGKNSKQLYFTLKFQIIIFVLVRQGPRELNE